MNNMKINGEYVLREIAGEYILVPIGNTAMEMNGMITLNEVGVFIWNKLQDECTCEQLLNAVLDEFDIDEEHAKNDLNEFLQQLEEAHLIHG